MPAAETGAPVAAHGVEFVDEDDARRVFLSLVEEVPHPGGPDADEHFNEIGTADAEEGNVRLPRDGPGQERLSRPRRTHEQHAFGDPSPETGELLGIFQKFNDFLEFVLRLVDPRHILEGDLLRLVRHEAGAALAEGHGLPAAGLHLAHEENPHADEENDGEPGDENRHVPAVPLGGFHGDAGPLLLEKGDEAGILWGVCLEGTAVVQFPIYVLAFDRHLGHLPLLGVFHEVAVKDFLIPSLGLVEHLE